MAHYAKLNEKDEVVDVVVATQEVIDRGVLGPAEQFVQTSFNTYRGQHVKGGEPLRYNFASVGGTYDRTADAFIPPKKYASWQLDTDTYTWRAPVAQPDDGNYYIWNEATQAWDPVA